MVNQKNLRVCQVKHDDISYDLLVAVASLDEVDGILQEWALNKLGEPLVLPSELLLNKNLNELQSIGAFNFDEFVYLESPSKDYIHRAKAVGISGEFPVIPKTLLTGDILSMPETLACLFSENFFTGFFGEHVIPALPLQMTAGMNYVGIAAQTVGEHIEYTWVNYTSMDSFNYSSSFPVVSVLFFGGAVYFSPFFTRTTGLSENKNAVTNNCKMIPIPTMSIGVTMSIILSEFFIRRNDLRMVEVLPADTALIDNNLFMFYKNNFGLFVSEVRNTLISDRYQADTGLNTLPDNTVVENYIFRAVDGDKILLFVVPNRYFESIQLGAIADHTVELPDQIKNSSVYVGRILVPKGATTAAQCFIQMNRANLSTNSL